MKYLIILMILAVALLSACAQKIDDAGVVVDDTPVVELNTTPEPAPIVPTREQRISMAAHDAGYIGKALAGDVTFYLTFNDHDYEQALNEDKLILLNFWNEDCSYCDNDAALAAFDSMDYTDVIGFRVNINSDAVTSDERAIASKFGVNTVGTKIILKGGKRVLKATDSWNKQGFLDAVEQNRG